MIKSKIELRKRIDQVHNYWSKAITKNILICIGLFLDDKSKQDWIMFISQP